VLVITLGEPHSINIRAIGNCLALTKEIQQSMPVVILGSIFQWHDQIDKLGKIPFYNIQSELSIYRQIKVVDSLPSSSGLWFLDTGGPKKSYLELTPIERSKLTADNLTAVPKDSPRLAVVTGPVDKKIVALTLKDFRGQTEFFSDLWEDEALMLLAGPKLRVGLVTNHVALNQVSSLITPELLTRKMKKFALALKSTFGIKLPRIAVCGLNPHAGDGGLFGFEDETVISKTLKNYSGNAEFFGPISADTAFYFCLQGQYDGVLAMYHDQGLAPMKTVYFDEAINISAGLRHLRVSPDHGPAYQLISSSQVSIKSFENAFLLAIEYLKRN
jgi:4-hydroxy-L-threonine phosphate dehydrogenase PdxA